MRRRLFAVAAVVGVAVAMTPATAADASTSNSLPAVCVHQPLPLFPGAQIEVGYCPNG